MSTLRPFIASFFSFTLALAGSPACAQWQWIDKDGRKVFSDRAPPPDVADKNIVQRPANRVRPANVVPGGDAEVPKPGGSAPAANGAPLLPTADKELEAKRKQAADAEAAKRKADEERVAKAKIENCARAKQAKATLDTGARIAQTNSKGEREMMDDSARAAESRRVQGIIDSECR